MNEFDFIRLYLQNAQKQDNELILGIGDDAAILRPQPGYDLHISTDMLLAGRHFFADISPEDLAYKVLAVNLSDMAAMGATPKWALLSAALPQLDSVWLKRFCAVFFDLANAHQLSLIGGDTTRGDLAFNLTIIGTTPQGRALRRDKAQVGDDIWVTGKIGLAVAALHHHWHKVTLSPALFEQCEAMRLKPPSRVKLAEKLLYLAHAAQDISDGLAQDLGHILKASAVGAEIWADKINSLKELIQYPDYYQWVLAGGDDYELIFTAPEQQRHTIEQLSETFHTEISRIGVITAQSAFNIFTDNGQALNLTKKGYDHFEE